jgi:hypothetical protein
MTSSNPATELMRLVTGYRVAQAIHVVAALGIADLLKEGPCSAADLSVVTNSHPTALYPMLRALAAAGVFHEHDDKRFSLTPLGACLRSDAERPIAAYAAFVGRPHQWHAWGALLYSAQTGRLSPYPRKGPRTLNRALDLPARRFVWVAQIQRSKELPHPRTHVPLRVGWMVQARPDRSSPVLFSDLGLRQASHLPRLPPTAIPINIDIPERHET